MTQPHIITETNNFWFNLKIQIGKIKIGTAEKLASYFKFNDVKLRNSNPQYYYNVFIKDPKSETIPILEVAEWQKDGYMQLILTEPHKLLPEGKTLEQIMTTIHEQERFAYILTSKLCETVDDYFGACNIQLLQVGPDAQPFFPFYLVMFGAFLEIVALYYKCDTVHEAILRLPDFSKTQISVDTVRDLIYVSLERNPNGPFKVLLDATGGNLTQVVESLMTFYLPFINQYQKIYLTQELLIILAS